MKGRLFDLLIIGFISCCLVIGLLGKTAIADNGEPSRSGQAYEQQRTCVGGYCFYTARQYTSAYDLARGEIYPEVTIQYATLDYDRMLNPYARDTEYSYKASAIGGLFSGPIMRLPVSGASYLLGTIGAPQVQMYQSQGMFTGSINFTSVYPGLGLQGAGFMLGPFGGGWGGWGGWGGYCAYCTGGTTGSYPQVIY